MGSLKVSGDSEATHLSICELFTLWTKLIFFSYFFPVVLCTTFIPSAAVCLGNLTNLHIDLSEVQSEGNFIGCKTLSKASLSSQIEMNFGFSCFR